MPKEKKKWMGWAEWSKSKGKGKDDKKKPKKKVSKK
jgi:hypothetical protein